MIDDLYVEAQAQLNKEQLGYLKPLYYNSFIRSGQIKIVNKMLTDVKSSVRKANWMLDGKDFANFSEKTRQLLEYYSDETNLVPVTTEIFTLPSNLSFIENVYIGTTKLDKITYNDFLMLQGNIYASATTCDPICSKVGVNLKVAPPTTETLQLHFLRQPLVPKWTYVEADGKAMFDPTANDFQDIDLPENLYDELLSLVVEKASISLRELNIAQLANQDQAQDERVENKQ
tara:strand:- start:994 stop:1686 length:693 start_codon:yes stop_codon:yes gene_type:complete